MDPVAADLNWASTSLLQRDGSEQLIVDAEVREARVTIGRSWSNGFAAQLQILYRYTGGGVLDDAIDSWHDFFGLPEGARAIMPTDRIRVAYASAAQSCSTCNRRSPGSRTSRSTSVARCMTRLPALSRPG